MLKSVVDDHDGPGVFLDECFERVVIPPNVIWGVDDDLNKLWNTDGLGSPALSMTRLNEWRISNLYRDGIIDEDVAAVLLLNELAVIISPDVAKRAPVHN